MRNDMNEFENLKNIPQPSISSQKFKNKGFKYNLKIRQN